MIVIEDGIKVTDKRSNKVCHDLFCPLPKLLNIEERIWGNTAAFQTATEIIAKRTEKKYFVFPRTPEEKEIQYICNTEIQKLCF